MNVLARLPKPIKRLHWKYRELLWEYHRRHSESVTLQTQQGIFKIPMSGGDAISRHLFARREFELEWIVDALAFLRRQDLCPPKGQGTVLDVGANCGVISIGMLATGEVERAIAIEPAPKNFAMLRENIAANGFDERFTCLNFAVADQRAELEFELCEKNFGDHRIRSKHTPAESREHFQESERRVIKVQADSIDNLLAGLNADRAQEVSFVWIDVQGYEGYAFRGAAKLLSRGIPVVSEVWPYGIERAGMSLAAYCEIASSFWSNYWTERRGKFVRHSMDELPAYLAKLNRGVKHKNVIFTA